MSDAVVKQFDSIGGQLLGLSGGRYGFGYQIGAETDGRLLGVRARFSRGWNLVDL
ncbi:hypothetical protein D3C79_613000 [compost metagenome]